MRECNSKYILDRVRKLCWNGEFFHLKIYLRQVHISEDDANNAFVILNEAITRDNYCHISKERRERLIMCGHLLITKYPIKQSLIEKFGKLILRESVTVCL